VDGIPGAGYVRPGAGAGGPIAAEIVRVDLRSFRPSLVIVQAGHDDIGVPPALERRRVEQAVAMIHAEAPRARIAVLTVFAGRSRRAAQMEEALRRACEAGLPRPKRPAAFHPVQELPLGPTGKLARRHLREVARR
jgi:acyl-CoA synthetase (AMP-forming)/AMP-acid ligase II